MSGIKAWVDAGEEALNEDEGVGTDFQDWARMYAPKIIEYLKSTASYQREDQGADYTGANPNDHIVKRLQDRIDDLSRGYNMLFEESKVRLEQIVSLETASARIMSAWTDSEGDTVDTNKLEQGVTMLFRLGLKFVDASKDDTAAVMLKDSDGADEEDA